MSFFFCKIKYHELRLLNNPKVFVFVFSFLIYLKINNSMQIPYEGTHLKLRIYTYVYSYLLYI